MCSRQDTSVLLTPVTLLQSGSGLLFAYFSSCTCWSQGTSAVRVPYCCIISSTHSASRHTVWSLLISCCLAHAPCLHFSSLLLAGVDTLRCLLLLLPTSLSHCCTHLSACCRAAPTSTLPSSGLSTDSSDVLLLFATLLPPVSTPVIFCLAFTLLAAAATALQLLLCRCRE